MRLPIILLSFLLLLPFAAADLTVQIHQFHYNIGDTIDGSASVSPSEDISGSIKGTLRCDGRDFPYFQIPVQASEGFRSEVDVPKMRALESMEGDCRLRVELIDYETLDTVETEESDEFTISDGLEVALLETNRSVRPGSSVVVEGVVRAASGDPINGEVRVRFDGERSEAKTTNGRFLVQLGLSPTIKSGEHTLRVVVEDGRGNEGSVMDTLTVTPIPTRLKLDLQAKAFSPGANLTYLAAVYDQADDLMEQVINLELKDPEDEFLLKTRVDSGRQHVYDIPQFSAPGTYAFFASSGELFADQTFTVREVRDIRISQSEQEVVIDNIGNVRYKDEMTVILQGDSDNYLIAENVDLEPGESMTLDLSREVPEGTYNVLLPDSSQAASSEIVNQDLLAEGVFIPDDRSTLKKTTSAISHITGSIVGADGVLVENAWVAPLLLVLLLVGLTFYYGKGLLPRLFRRKKQ